MPATLTVVACIPMYDTTIFLAEAGTFCNLKLPFASVVVTIFVPGMRTVAPMTGSPCESVTRPVTRLCAEAVAAESRVENCLIAISSVR